MKYRYEILFFIPYMILAALFLHGCNKNSELTSLELFGDIEPDSDVGIEFEELHLDILKLETIESSYVGFISVSDDSIRFFDERFGWVFVFDEEGVFHQRHLGQGRGPKELPMAGIQFYSPIPAGGHLFVGSSYDFYEFNEHYKRINSSVINWWLFDVPSHELENNPAPENPRSYNPNYEMGDFRVTSTHAYLPLASGVPEFTSFNFTTDLYALEARILARINIENANVEKVIGRLSPVYYEQDILRPFSLGFSFDILNENKFAVTYMVDSLIYIFDEEFSALQESFGFAGRDMKTNYQRLPSTTNNSVLREYWFNEIMNRGYYTSLNYIKERDLLFRSYQKGNHSESDGLQVYRGNRLIADVDVPKNDNSFASFHHFEVVGYIDPWFYSNAFIDEMGEEITVYRFRIDE